MFERFEKFRFEREIVVILINVVYFTFVYCRFLILTSESIDLRVISTTVLTMSHHALIEQDLNIWKLMHEMEG